MIGKVACLCWHKFVHSGNKNYRKMNWRPAEVLGESLQECGLIHLKLRSWADSDLREGLCGQHFSSLPGVPAGTQSLPGDGALWGREQCTKSCGGSQETRTDWQTLLSRNSLPGRQNLYCQYITYHISQQSHVQSQPKEIKKEVKYVSCECQENTMQSKWPGFPYL